MPAGLQSLGKVLCRELCSQVLPPRLCCSRHSGAVKLLRLTCCGPDSVAFPGRLQSCGFAPVAQCGFDEFVKF